METIEPKTALITGASSGIGKELAKLFAKDGYGLVLVARHDDRLQTVADALTDQYGTHVLVIDKDLTKAEAPQQLYDEVKAKGLTINVLVNNAGVGEHGYFAVDTDLQKELDLIQLNVISLVHLTKLFVWDMVARNEGKILNLASVASLMPNPLVAIYGASKAFVLSFSEALSNELRHTDVTVTALLPGPTNTEWFAKAGAEHTNAAQGSLADPAEVAKDGYDGLMAGKSKVVSGTKNKVLAALSNLRTDRQNANSARHLMEADTPREGWKTANWVIGISAAAVVAAGVILVNRYRNLSPDEKERYQAKIGDLLDSAGDIAQGVMRQVAHNMLKARGFIQDELEEADVVEA